MKKKVLPFYKVRKPKQTTLRGRSSVVSEPLERKIERMTQNGEPIDSLPGGGELIYTEKSEGVNPAYDIRTDRFEVALDAVEKVNKSKTAKAKKQAKPQTDNDTGEQVSDK